MIFGFRTKFYDLFLCKKRRSRFQAGLEFAGACFLCEEQ
jgi:hypothetical protein